MDSLKALFIVAQEAVPEVVRQAKDEAAQAWEALRASNAQCKALSRKKAELRGEVLRLEELAADLRGDIDELTQLLLH